VPDDAEFDDAFDEEVGSIDALGSIMLDDIPDEEYV